MKHQFTGYFINAIGTRIEIPFMYAENEADALKQVFDFIEYTKQTRYVDLKSVFVRGGFN